MPLGFERLNERTQRPNALINFIKPLPGLTSPTAEAILNRVAAICYPFMKKHMILVQALEEFPFNNEFVGRNFNAGEVIQLVLRNRKGEWLPDRCVMMVMVHELAHCKHMNHSKAFWKVKDMYAADLRELWMKGYTGEGLWGRGRDLASGSLLRGSVGVADMPEHLCGGTYQSRRKKRRRVGKEKETLTYAEKKQRRILKKFGTGGQALGADDDTKIKLEGGVTKKGKPRVAGSQRGRELRVAAALERFGAAKKQEPEVKKEEVGSESETEGEYEGMGENEAAVDVDGKRMVDEKGHALVKVCEDEDENDDHAMKEMEEIQGFQKQIDALRVSNSQPEFRRRPLRETTKTTFAPKGTAAKPLATNTRDLTPPSKRSSSTQVDCPICSLVNEAGSLTCAVCSNVLNPHLVPNNWKCKSTTCEGNEYTNSGDAGVCGVCGSSRSAVS
ncbi:WLM-domain-containing protein [Lindgomyces ingoldianus]|uniref:WLM-domain-containing protein n=1 Tax=Lindgomyces ingoldianus TaxID=673940 RepID=A0ACB6QJ28_9PLEO|nr:WLM-domain-containing protein [Lindgomyces ingoldianus]KAF2466598.1 WLM-domain-containing protein [Lindgomyces ingoldianus]